MTRTRLLVLAVGVLVVGVIVRSYLGSDRRQIERQLARLAEAASVDHAESPLEQMTHAAQVARFFTDDVAIRLAQDSSSVIGGRDAVLALAAQARRSGSLTVAFEDVHLTVNDASSASGHAVVTGTGPNIQSGLAESREATLTFRKIQGEWLIAGVEGVRTLERPQ